MSTADTYDLTDREYKILSDLYHEATDIFHTLPRYIQQAFWNRVYAKQAN